MDDKLKVSIKPKVENPTKSADYQIKVDGWELGKGVTKVELDMTANERPFLKIECYPDEIDIENMDADIEKQEHRFYN